MQIILPNEWNPRRYQLPAWNALSSGIKRALLIWHRRAGKDDVCLHFAATQAMQRVGNYWHMLPEYAQARKSVWNAVNPHTGKRRIDEAFPQALRKRMNTQEMLIEFVNGSTWQLVGSDSFNSLVGSPPIGVTASEWALANPAAWAYLRPILRENGGWAVFITTPRGRNFTHRMYEGALNDPAWFVQKLTVAETGVLSPAELASEQAEYVREYGADDGENLFRQEYYCDFDAALVGAYFARQMSDAEREGRIAAVPYDPRHPVHTSWDLGMDDATAIWFWQVVGAQVRLIDYLENNGQTLGWYAAELRSRPYVYGEHYLPHDAEITDISAAGGMSRKQTLESLGLRCRVVPRVNHKADAIHAVRSILPRCVFDKEKTRLGVDALAQYRRVFDQERKTYQDRPYHDWTSHAVDAFDGMARSVEQASPGAEWAKPLQYPQLGYG